MNRRTFNQSVITTIGAAGLSSISEASEAEQEQETEPYHYNKGDLISTDIFVSDKNRSNVSLASLLGKPEETALNVLFIFGGGDLGSGETGHLWCQDSFEDTHILRTLVSKYENYEVNFIAIAAAPVYHSKTLGFPDGVFLNESSDSRAFKRAESAFIESTMAAFDEGILPIEPYFDTRFRLMLNRSPQMLPSAKLGEIAPWEGAFRAIDETAFYGVPSFWVLSNSGEVLAEPMRGNVYHPHEGEVNINYSFSDMDKLLQSLL